MKPIPTLLAILLIFAVTGGGIFLLKKYMPEAAKEQRKKVEVGIEVSEVKAEDVELTIPSQGLVRPEVETVATSEVAGQVKWISTEFKAGGVFKTGDVLLELDDTDYQAALKQAKAEAAAAELDLKLELSRKAQALRDWEELGGDREASALAKREPQVAAAEARLAAANAAVTKAEKDLGRTKLVALYDGRVRKAHTDIGSSVTPGAQLAELYATENYEVRLPLSLNRFAFVDVHAPGDAVTLKTRVAGKTQEWKAKILRTEGQIDRSSRSVFVVAGLKAGAGGFTREDVLSPNLFVEAEIKGRTLKNVVEVPRKAFVGTDRVLVLDAENRLHFRKVVVEHEGTQKLYVSSGLNDGEKICVTALAAVVDGMKVRVLEEGKEGDVEEEGKGADPSPEAGEVAGAGAG